MFDEPPPTGLDAVDRAIVRATQAGLPLVAEPYAAVADGLGIDAEDLMRRLARMRDEGLIRRVAAIPNHYALGYRANGMSVWDIDDARVDELGARIGALEFVSHCYRRPRHLPGWPYNLFAMLHGVDRAAVERQLQDIRALAGDACRACEVIYSTRILKKTGLRI